MKPLTAVIETRLVTLLERLADGDDAPPAQRLRLEGLLEAAAVTGEASPGELQALVVRLYAQILGESLDERLGEYWTRRHPFPELPLYMRRAPVSPSTGD